ncbi:MAG TPA: hypothetical protein VGB17_19260 [Pyrinomonadaceae bacterium]|jgi:hypothetical protein
MAAVTRVKARPCTPVGYEVVDRVELAEDVVAGDLLVFTGAMSEGQAVMEKAGTSEIEPDAIALQDEFAGKRGYSVGIQGEMDGFSGMTPKTPLYPSGSTAGGLDTTAPEGAVIRIKAVTATRIRYNFV